MRQRLEEQTWPRPGIGAPHRPALGWTEIGIGIGCYLLLFVLLGGAIALLGGGAPPAVLLVAVSGVAALGAATIAVAVRVRSPAAVGLRRVSGRWLLLSAAAGVLAKLAGTVVALAYMLLTGDRSNPQQGLADTAAGSAGGLVLMLVFGAALVPLGEELLFRGMLYGGLRRYGVTISTVVSTGVFGLAHGINVVLPAAIVLGVLSALLYERSRSIWPSVVAHAMFNTIGFGLAALLLG
jgi:uncharacterized protein